MNALEKAGIIAKLDEITDDLIEIVQTDSVSDNYKVGSMLPRVRAELVTLREQVKDS